MLDCWSFRICGARWWAGDTIPSGLRSRAAMAIPSRFAILSLPWGPVLHSSAARALRSSAEKAAVPSAPGYRRLHFNLFGGVLRMQQKNCVRLGVFFQLVQCIRPRRIQQSILRLSLHQPGHDQGLLGQTGDRVENFASAGRELAGDTLRALQGEVTDEGSNPPEDY